MWTIGTASGIWRWRAALMRRVPARWDRLRLTMVTLALTSRLARIPVPLPSFALTIEGQRHLVRIANHHELAAAVEVLCTSDYDIPLDPADVQTVIDLGANAGFATLLFASRYPLGSIAALEPAPDTFARLVRNVGHLRNVTTMPLAAGQPGSIVFDLGVPSTERRGQSRSIAGYEIARVGLSEILARLGWDEVDLLKIDIEGDEFALLADPSIERARVIVGELHAAGAPDGFAGLNDVLPQFDVEHDPLGGVGVVMFRAIRRPPSGTC